jgi:hypothetical protein
MKRCPKCNRTYDDDTLKFCLEDGASLSGTTRDANPPATEILPRGGPTLKSSPDPTIPSFPNAASFRPQPSEVRAGNPVLTAGVIAIVLLLLALVGISAFFVFKKSGADESAKNDPVSSPTPSRVTSPTVREGPPVAGSEISSTESQTGTPLKITPSSSSVRLAVQANTYYPANAIDGKRSTAWIEGVDGPGLGEWIRFDFDREINLHRILIQPGYFKSPQIWAGNNRVATLTAYFSDGSARDLPFTDRMESQKVDIGTVRTKWVKFVIKSVYFGADPDTAISEVAFEWDQ